MSDSDPSTSSEDFHPAQEDGPSAPHASGDATSKNGGHQGVDASEEASRNAGDESDNAFECLGAFLENVRAPIAEDNPAGESILYDEDFRALKLQIDNIASASGAASYEEIVELARSLLTEKAKDLRVAGYLVIGEARLNGAEGVVEALHALRLLLDTYWDNLFPEKSRMRGRGSALQFMADRLPQWLDTASFKKKDRPHLETVLEHLEAIQEFSLQEMGEHAPSLSGLVSDIEGEIDDLPDPDPEPDPEPDSEVESNEDDPDTRLVSDEAEDTAGEPCAREGAVPEKVASETDALQSIRVVAEYYRERDGTNPLSYRLLRTVRWGTLRSEPSNEEGRTRLEAPREQRRTYLEGLLEENKYETLLREGETSFQSGTFHVWLDLQRLVSGALDNLGAPYRDSRDAVLLELAQLVRRVPELLSLTYSDGTPFASPLTVDWIDSKVLPLLDGGDPRPNESGAINGLGAVTDDYDEARNELRGGDLAGALSIMREGAAADRSKKEAFYRQLYVASLCVKGGHAEIAKPLLDELDVTIKKYNLDAWDPSLALEVWTTRYECYERLTKDTAPNESDSLRSEAEATFEKICRTDPEHAVAVDRRRLE